MLLLATCCLLCSQEPQDFAFEKDYLWETVRNIVIAQERLGERDRGTWRHLEDARYHAVTVYKLLEEREQLELNDCAASDCTICD